MIARGRAKSGTAQSCDRGARRPKTQTVVVIIAALFELISASAQSADLSSAIIRGSSVYSASELFAVYRDQLGKPITVDGARAIVSGLAAKYEADGYTRPQIRVDDALIAAGVLRIDVLETRIDEVVIGGDPGPYRARLEHLGAELTARSPVARAGMEATLRQMRALPGLTVAASTARDPEQLNVYRLDLDTQFDRTSGAVRISNRGTEEAGPEFVLGQVVANGLFGGRTNAGLLFGAALDYEEYRGLGALTNVVVGDSGARLSSTVFRSRSNPHEAVVDRDDLYLRDRMSLRYTRPVADGRVRTSLFVGLDLDDLSIHRNDLLLRDERLRMLELDASLSWRAGAATQYAGTLEIVKGLDGLGSGLVARDLAVDPRRVDFALTRLTLIRSTRFAELWSVRLDGFAQTSAYVLPYNERFKIGGDRLGRGFEVAEIAGDQGIGAKVELRRALAAAPEAFGRVSVYGFYDVGAAWKQDVAGRESAATAGIGFATQRSRTSANVELAQPLTHPDVEGNTSLSLFAELSINF